MADNYLEKKMEEFRSAPQKGVAKRPKTQIKQLLQKNRVTLFLMQKWWLGSLI